jgi:predicted RND superfamily exporter protein
VLFRSILINQKSLIQTFWTVFPLISGFSLTLGVMALLHVKLNYFNIVAFPSLIGMGDDYGVYYYRRWLELHGSVQATHDDLAESMSISAMTTILGYSGMAFARHSGLNSVGTVACLGLFLIWTASLVLLPGALNLFYKKRA